MLILAIETSCDDTCAAVLKDRRIQSNIISSQVNLHQEWGGVVPDIAKRAHQERIESVVNLALKRAKITLNDVDFIAVTRGPGLSIALAVGLNYAKKLAKEYGKKIIGVNHVEGHLLSNLLQNKKGLPQRHVSFPILSLTVSGGHTKIVLIKSIGDYQIIGETLDDAAGEALDKSAKLMGLGYPGGPVIEKLAQTGDINFLNLPRPLADKKILDYSFSGLKTAFYYQIRDWPREKVLKNVNHLSASFQNAVFDTLIRKFILAIEKFHPQTLFLSGGVAANLNLRSRLRKIKKKYTLPVYFPFKKELNTDNAAMIALTAYYLAQKNQYSILETLDVNPNLEL